MWGRGEGASIRTPAGSLNTDPELLRGYMRACACTHMLHIDGWATSPTLHFTTYTSSIDSRNMGTIDKGPCKIAAFSGYTGDRFDALKTQAEGSGAPILFGDYLAEMVSRELAGQASEALLL